MDFLKNFDPTPMRLAKLAGVLLAALVVLAVVAQIVAPSLPRMIAPRMGQTAYDEESYSTIGYAGGGSAGYSGDNDSYNTKPSAAPMPPMDGGIQLSSRNVATIKSEMSMPPIINGGGAGSDAEAYEVKDYNATIETRTLDQTCAAFTELKAKTFCRIREFELV